MRRYIALLRGVNISGKNKVPMAELKLGFESLGFPDVRTWLNSGNVVFSSEETEPAALTGQIEGMIQRRFGLEIPVFVLPQEELADTLRHAPDWWGTEDPDGEYRPENRSFIEIGTEGIYDYDLCLYARYDGRLGDRACDRRAAFRPFFQAGRTGGITQNSWHLQGTGHEHGRADDPAGLRGR